MAKRLFAAVFIAFATLACDVTMSDDEQTALDEFTDKIVAEYRYEAFLNNRMKPLVTYFTEEYMKASAPQKPSQSAMEWAALGLFLGDKESANTLDSGLSYNSRVATYKKWVEKCGSIAEKELVVLANAVVCDYEGYSEMDLEGCEYFNSFDDAQKQLLCTRLFGTPNSIPDAEARNNALIAWEICYLSNVEVPQVIAVEWVEDNKWSVEYSKGNDYLITFYKNSAGKTCIKAVPVELDRIEY